MVKRVRKKTPEGDGIGFGSGSENLFSDLEYYNGWSEDHDVVLIHRDPASGARIQERHPLDWYFWVLTKEFEAVPEKNKKWLLRNYVKRAVVDETFPAYTRFYVDRKFPKLNKKKIFDLVGDPEFGANWASAFYGPERTASVRFPRDRERWTDLHEVVSWCQRKGVTPLEADLTPRQRFLVDNDLRIQEKYHVGYIDIETDDRAGGFDNKEQNRILSIAWEGDKFDSDSSDDGFLLCEEDTDEAEREMLMEFKRQCLKVYDLFAAWNGFGFDFPVIFARFQHHKISIDWRKYLFVDPLPIFRRHYVRGGDDAVSYALDSIGEKVLGLKKVDWRDEFRERHPGVTPTFYNLWNYDKELLERYNRHDVRICRKLEEFTGFVAIEQIFCRIANNFGNDWNLSTKIDLLLLKKGYKEGHHFPTRYWAGRRPEQYEGAYVFDPKVGYHRNVAAFDFKSLYPSMIRAFNISPETIIKAGDRDKFDPSDVCTIPTFEVEGEDGPEERGGSTFRRDREGYISQMFVQTLERRKKYTDLQKVRLDEVGTTDDDLYRLYNRLAYSFKRLGLSFYGDLGNARSRYYDTELAQSITLAGQFFIRLTSKIAASFGMAPLYGDSITADRCVVIRDPLGRVRVEPVERIFELFEWRDRGDGKEVVDTDGWLALTNDDNGVGRWAPLNGIVRHLTNKRIYRLSTPEGVVETTEDHGIIVENFGTFEAKRPIDVFNDSDELYRVSVPENLSSIDTLDILDEVGSYKRIYRRFVSPARYEKKSIVTLEAVGENELAIVFRGDIGYSPAEKIRFHRFYRSGTEEMEALLELLGTFCAEGSVCLGGDGSYHGASIFMEDVEYIKKLANFYWKLAPSQYGTGLTDGGRKLQMRSELLSTVFGRLCGVGCDGKRVPSFIFSLPKEDQRTFLIAYLRGDGSFWRDRNSVGNEFDFDGWECGSNSLELTSGIAFLARSLQIPYSVRLPRDLKSGSISWGIRTKKLRDRSRAFNGRSWRAKPRIEEIPYDGYVYDLSVSGTHRFVEALGCVALHNTDSVYVQLAPNDKEWPTEEARMSELLKTGEVFVKKCQEEYLKVLQDCNCNLDWDAIILEFEDVFDRIFFVTKKRYAGRLILHKGSKSDNVEVKGLEVMRSDCSGMTRRLQQEILDAILMKDMTADQIIETILEPEYKRCETGQLTLSEISIGKGISKDPEKYKTKPLHVKIAQKIKAGGREFYIGMKIVYVVTGMKPTLQGVLAEDYGELGVIYDPVYYWDRVIFPATHRVLQTVFPDVDWGAWYVGESIRRRNLVDRYRKWMLDRKKVQKAFDRIRENKKGTLRPADIEELRRAPKVRRVADGKA